MNHSLLCTGEHWLLGSINTPENEVSVKTTLVPWQIVVGVDIVNPASGFLLT